MDRNANCWVCDVGLVDWEIKENDDAIKRGCKNHHPICYNCAMDAM